MTETVVGQINHYYNKIGVAVVLIHLGEIAVGDTVKFQDSSRGFQQVVSSLEVEGQPVGKVSAGEEAGMKVNEPVKAGWQVIKVVD